MKNNQIGIVGVGYWGTNILNVLHKIGIKDIHCHDSNIENLKEVKKFPKVKNCKEFPDFLNKNFLGVIIAVDTKLHFKIAEKCLKRGFNIFVEKPVTNSSKKIEIASKNCCIKKSFYNEWLYLFYNDFIRYIKKIIKNNYLGEINYVSCERFNLGPVRNDVSAAWDLSSHDIAICNYLFDKNLTITNVHGYDFLKKNINDISTISAKINKIRLDIKSSWLNPEKLEKL